MRGSLVQLLFALFFGALSTGALAQARSHDDVWMTFGNWRLEIVTENKSIRLVGVITEGQGAYFALQCYSKSPVISIQVPIFDAREIAAADRRTVVQLTAWNDREPPETIIMLRFQKMGAIALLNKEKLAKSDPDAVAADRFVAKLRGASTFFSFEAGGPTRTYDVKHLRAAHHKFDESCAAIRHDWEGFMSRR